MSDQDSTMDAEADQRTPEANNAGSSDADVRRVSEEQETQGKTKRKHNYPKERKPIPLHKRRRAIKISEAFEHLPLEERRVAEDTKRLLLCGSLTQHGMTRQKIAEVAGISVRQVTTYVERCKVAFPLLSQIDNYRETRAELIETTENLALQSLSARLSDTEALKNEKLRDIAYSFDVVHQSGRLERGKSTANVNNCNTFSKLALPPQGGTPPISIEQEPDDR